jgi:hypothetical protein
MFLVLQAKAVQTWKQALFIVREDETTLLRWHRLKMGSSAMLPLLYGCCTKVKIKTHQAACSLD